MRARPLALLFLACLCLVSCNRTRNQPPEDVEHPELWINRVFARIEGSATTAPIPVSGRSLSAFVTTPSGEPPLFAMIEGYGTLPLNEAKPAPFDGFSQITFTLPIAIKPGDYRLRFTNGSESTPWIDLPVTNPRLLERRRSIATLAAALPEAQRPGLTLLLDYKPLPRGIYLVDSIDDETAYGPTGEDEWLVYGVNVQSGLAQPDAFWAVGNTVQGLTVVANPIGPIGPIKPIGWPEGRDSANTFYAIPDFSNPINQNDQVFDAATEDDAGKPIRTPPQNPAPTPPPPPVAPPPPPAGHGLTGDLGPCPSGRKTLAVVLEFDDNTGFDWLMGKTRDTLLQLGATDTLLVPTERFSSQEHRFDADALRAILEGVANGLDCDCDELVLSIIGHGKTNRDGKHFLIFKDRWNGRTRRTETPTEDVVKLVAKAFHDAGKDCVPVTLLLQPCYSGAALDEIPDAVESGAGGPRPKFRVIAASAADQTANGDWNGDDGYPDIYFLDALLDCSKDPQFDFNQDGSVSLQESWICMLEKVWMLSLGQSGKPQNPKKWP